MNSTLCCVKSKGCHELSLADDGSSQPHLFGKLDAGYNQDHQVNTLEEDHHGNSAHKSSTPGWMMNEVIACEMFVD